MHRLLSCMSTKASPHLNPSAEALIVVLTHSTRISCSLRLALSTHLLIVEPFLRGAVFGLLSFGALACYCSPLTTHPFAALSWILNFLRWILAWKWGKKSGFFLFRCVSSVCKLDCVRIFFFELTSPVSYACICMMYDHLRRSASSSCNLEWSSTPWLCCGVVNVASSHREKKNRLRMFCGHIG